MCPFNPHTYSMKTVLGLKWTELTQQSRIVCFLASFCVITTETISSCLREENINQGQTCLKALANVQSRFSFVFNTQTEWLKLQNGLEQIEGHGRRKKSKTNKKSFFSLFPVCSPVSSPETPCLLTWQHVILCQVLSPKKTRWTERSEKHAHKGMWTAFSLWLCFNRSQMQLQSENTSDLFKQQCTLALSKTCRIGGVGGID